MKESELLKLIQVKASQLGARLFRNNVARGWIGSYERVTRQQNIPVFPGDVVIRQARRLHSGLGVGSCDLIGWTPVKVTEAMLGRELAVFTGIEGKTGKQIATDQQHAFINTVNNMGGIARILRDADNLEAVIKEARGNGV